MIEITTFRLAAATAEHELLGADRLVQARFAPRQAGFLRRTTARGDDGEWVTIVLWATGADAVAAGEAADQDPWTAALVALLEPASIVVRRYTELD